MYLEDIHAFQAMCAPSLSEQILPFITALKASQYLFFFLIYTAAQSASMLSIVNYYF